MSATNAINHPGAGVFQHTYGDAIGESCRATTFGRFNSKFEVDIGKSRVIVEGGKSPKIPKALKGLINKSIRKSIDYENLAYTPNFDKFGKPDLYSYHAAMFQQADAELTKIRHDIPNAKGLWVVPSIYFANYATELVHLLTGDKPINCNSSLPNADKLIGRFRNSDKKWIISPNMVSEGVDIPLLACCIYMPNSKTELYFRQALGRVVRMIDKDDFTRAYFLMPMLEIFDKYARRIEEEMPPVPPKVNRAPSTKKCPSCHQQCAMTDKNCSFCGTVFPSSAKVNYKKCSKCSSLMPQKAIICANCGTMQTSSFQVDYKNAWRQGVICRGIDISDQDAIEGSKLFQSMKADILYSGNPNLIKIVQQIPPEGMTALATLIKKHSKSP